MAKKILETNRLVLRKWNLNKDLEAFTKINQDPLVMEYFPSTWDEQKVKDFIINANKVYEENKYTWFACELKQTHELIGFVGLRKIDWKELPFSPAVEVGWRLSSKHWGHGYAPEAAKKCLEYGFSLGLEEILSFTSKINLKSRKVMEKLNMQYSDDFKHPLLEEGHRLSEHVLYKITKEEFEKNR